MPSSYLRNRAIAAASSEPYPYFESTPVAPASVSESLSAWIASPAVAYAQSKGVILVASAGNEPTQKATYPAAYRNVIGVSALDASGNLWESSNYGSFVTVAAPGTASFPVGYKGPPGAYEGTSISSAYVSRALALYLAKHPKATASEAIQALKDSLTDAGATGVDSKYGYGSLDAAAMARFLR
jgi:hypothetical protein